MRVRIAIAPVLVLPVVGGVSALPAEARNPSVIVREGAVMVRDLARRRRVLVTAGHRYLARKRAHRARRRH